MRRTALILIASLRGFAFSHPADISHLSVSVAPQQIESRYSVNIATLARIARIDRNGDNQVTFDEIKSLEPAVRAFLVEQNLMVVNGSPTTLGEFKGSECIWPNPESTVLKPQNADQRFVDFRFVQDWPQVVSTLELRIEGFHTLGELHTMEAVFEQSNEPETHVTFSRAEPAFIYHTGWPAQTSSARAIPQHSSPYVLIWACIVAVIGTGIWTVSRRRT